MLVNQIAVFLENRKGRLFSMLNALSEAKINVESLNIADTRDFGIVRIITDDNEGAKKALAAAGFTAADTDLVAIEVDDVPGSLTATLGAVAKWAYDRACAARGVGEDRAEKLLH